MGAGKDDVFVDPLSDVPGRLVLGYVWPQGQPTYSRQITDSEYRTLRNAAHDQGVSPGQWIALLGSILGVSWLDLDGGGLLTRDALRRAWPQ